MRVVVLILMLALGQTQSPANVTGKWQWQGTAGWQRIQLDLKAEGSTLTGIIHMGPGSNEPATPADYWEYFFDPVDFQIFNGAVEGSSISFEQRVNRPLSPAVQPQTRAGASAAKVPQTSLTYKGVIQGDQILMTRELVPDSSDHWRIGTHKVQFTLQRVK